MRRIAAVLILLAGAALGTSLLLRAQESGSVAVIYYWKAKPGKLEDYSRYIQTIAEPVDADAQRHGAFLSITTYVSHKPDGPWSHMRVFIVKDRAQAAALAQALDDADVRVEPDQSKRRAHSDLSASLRDFVAEEEFDILR
jgi:hypothetical protein